jgi:hypothetical protein
LDVSPRDAWKRALIDPVNAPHSVLEALDARMAEPMSVER